MAQAISDALDCLFGQDEQAPLEADRLAESLSFDPAMLDRAIAEYLGQIDDLGGALTDLLRSERVSLWLYGAALAATASVVAGRWSRKPSDSRLSEDGEEVMPSGLFGLNPEES